MYYISKKDELDNCNAVKTILMILVVLYHSMVIYAGTWGPYPPAEQSVLFEQIAKWLNSFHIYAFTLVSGYIFYYIKYEKGGYQKYTLFLGNKAKRLLVPYIFIASVWVAPIYVYFWGTEHVISNFLFGIAPNQLWFLLMLFWVFAIFWPLSDLIKRRPICGIIIICALYCLGMVFPSYWRINTAMQYILFFSIGFLIRKCGRKILYQIPSAVYISCDVLLFTVVEVLAPYYALTIKLMKFGLRLCLYVLGSVSAFVLLQRFANRFLQGNKIINFFGKHSMVIYLVHQQLIYFSIGWFNGIVPPVVLVMINFVFSLTVSTAFSILMHKTKVTRFLVGSK